MEALVQINRAQSQSIEMVFVIVIETENERIIEYDSEHRCAETLSSEAEHKNR